MKRLFSKTMLAAMVASLIPVQHAQADWTTLAQCAAIVGTMTTTAFLLGWAKDISVNQEKIEKYRKDQLPQAPGGANANIAAPERDSRPAQYASEYGMFMLVVASPLAFAYGLRPR